MQYILFTHAAARRTFAGIGRWSPRMERQMTKFVFLVIEAEGHYGDYATVVRQSKSRAAAEKFATAGWRVLPIDAEFANSYGKGRRIHREDVRRIAVQNAAA